MSAIIFAAAVPLMDALTTETRTKGLVDTVTNERGVLVGHFMEEAKPKEILTLWMERITQ